MGRSSPTQAKPVKRWDLVLAHKKGDPTRLKEKVNFNTPSSHSRSFECFLEGDNNHKFTKPVNSECSPKAAGNSSH